MKNLYLVILTKVNCSEINEKNGILLKREKNPNELNIIPGKKTEEWTFLHIQLKISFKIHADILK